MCLVTALGAPGVLGPVSTEGGFLRSWSGRRRRARAETERVGAAGRGECSPGSPRLARAGGARVGWQRAGAGRVGRGGARGRSGHGGSGPGHGGSGSGAVGRVGVRGRQSSSKRGPGTLSASRSAVASRQDSIGAHNPGQSSPMSPGGALSSFRRPIRGHRTPADRPLWAEPLRSVPPPRFDEESGGCGKRRARSGGCGKRRARSGGCGKRRARSGGCGKRRMRKAASAKRRMRKAADERRRTAR